VYLRGEPVDRQLLQEVQQLEHLADTEGALRRLFVE
jgi:hypothetical protein